MKHFQFAAECPEQALLGNAMRHQRHLGTEQLRHHVFKFCTGSGQMATGREGCCLPLSVFSFLPVRESVAYASHDTELIFTELAPLKGDGHQLRWR